MLKFILGGAGFGKSTVIINEIYKLADSGKKIIVIVPEQFSFDSDKKLYKKLGCRLFNRILSLSFTTMAREIFEKYGSRSGEYADDMHKYIIMHKTVKKLLSDKQLKYFARQAGRPDFINDALKIVVEFRQSGISADDFIAKMCGDNASLSEKISDLSMIYYTYDSMLAENELKDSLTDISEAAAIAEINDYFKNTVVFFDEFESFTGDEYKLIETIIGQSNDVYVSLRLEQLENNGVNLFDSVKNTWKRFYQIAQKYGKPIDTINLIKPVKYKNEDLAHLNLNILRPVRKRLSKSENIKICECRDLYEEADWICSEIKRLVRNDGYKYSEIAVMSRQLSEYTYIFEAACEKYEIPFSLDIKKSVMHTSIMQYISSIIEIISEKNFSSEMIFKYAKTSLSGVASERISELENYCYEWDIDGEKWMKPFSAGLDEYPFAEKTRKELVESLYKLRLKCVDTDSRGICRALFEFITEMNVQEKVNGIISGFKEKGFIYLAKEFKRIWGLLMDILEAVSETGGDISITGFRDIFIMMLRQISYSVPPQTLDGVRIVCAETARLDSPRAVFIAGVNDGFFPANISQNGILNETDRLLFEQSGISLSRSNEELIADEKLIVYKTITYASDKLYITYPLSDSMNRNRYAAPVLKQIREMYDNEILEYASDKNIIDYSLTPKAAYINLVQHFGETGQEIESIRKALENNEIYRGRIRYLENVSSDRNFIINDKSLMKRIYFDRLTISATAVEEYNTCHFKYFCHTGLKLRIKKKKAFDYISQGNLTHRCLEKILGSCKNKEEFDNLNHEQISEIIHKCINEFIEEGLGGKAMLTSSAKASLENISGNIEVLIRQLQCELRQSEFRPVAFELDVSEGGNSPVIKTADGIEIYLRGVVDRIDIYEKDNEKYLRVIDYKTGTKTFSISSLLYGINMQMLIYMFSVTGKNGRFSDYTPAGVLYMPSGGAACGRDRNDELSVDDYLSKHFKMNGIVLSDRTVLNAMEKDIKGVYIPAKLLKADGGTGTLKLNIKASSCLNAKNFKRLRSYTDSVLLKMCSELYGGQIQADPIIFGKAPCDYCDYWSVCGNVPVENYHEPEKNAEEIMMEKLGGENDEQMD